MLEVISEEKGAHQSTISARYEGSEIHITIPFTDEL